MTAPTIELKKVKIARHMSEETTAFTAELWIDGKVAAYVKNEGRGGDNFPRFIDRQVEKEFHAYCKAQPARVTEWGTFDVSYDDFIGDLLWDWELNAEYKRRCKKNVVILLDHQEKGMYSQYKGQLYTPAVAQRIRDHFGDKLVEIVNERYI